MNPYEVAEALNNRKEDKPLSKQQKAIVRAYDRGMAKKMRKYERRAKVEITKLLTKIIDGGMTMVEASEACGLVKTRAHDLKQRYRRIWEETELEIAARLREEQIVAFLQNRNNLNKLSTQAISYLADVLKDPSVRTETRVRVAQYLYEQAEAKQTGASEQARGFQFNPERAAAIQKAINFINAPVVAEIEAEKVDE